jgi:beta-glucosidase/6-phospho-beta-glucosidase/beta-galactosidase
VPRQTSQFERRNDPDAFWWSAGIEDTFVSAPWGAEQRTLDEYELTRHYAYWREDLALMAGLGITAARYGIPWYRINPEPGRWDWSWADRPLERLLELGVEPIVDLVHYGTPQWMSGAFTDPDFPERLADYAARVAERFRGRIFAYTPLNEPRITAWYAGRLGWWPPYRKGSRGFVAVLVAVCRAIALAIKAVRAAHPSNIIVHADAADLYRTDDAQLQSEADRRQQMVFLPLDLLMGRVGEDHALYPWLIAKGASVEELAWFQRSPVEPDILGLNFYPMFSNLTVVRSGSRTRVRQKRGAASLLRDAIEPHWERYRLPIMITETADRGSVRRREAWLAESVEEVRKLRVEGVPVIGYTWWPMISHIAWAFRQGTKDVANYVEKMGLWDLDAKADFKRIHTPLVDRYKAIVAGGPPRAGAKTLG